MSATTAVARGRTAAERLMVDTATVSRSTGDATLNPATGLLTPAPSVQVYQGPCRLRQPTAQETTVLFGERQVTLTRFIACFPHDTADLEVGDVITITDSHDADVLAASFRIAAAPLATFVIYKGYPCEVVE